MNPNNPTTQNDMEAAMLAAEQSQMPSAQGGADITAVGKKVKQIYPEYSDLSDEQVGLKFMTKYGDDKATMQSLGIPIQAVADPKETAQLRKEFHQLPIVKSYNEIKKQWANMQSAGEGGGGDIAVMYSYIKMLDPTTAVREGELALAAQAAGAPDRIVNIARKLDVEGAGIPPEMRNQMIQEGGKIYNNVATQAKEQQAFYKGIASDSGADPNKVVGGVGDIQIAEIPEMPTKEQEQGLTGLPGMIAGGAKAVGDFLAPDLMNLPQTIGGINERETQKNATRPDTKGNLTASASYALDRTLGFAGDTVPKSIMPAVEAVGLTGVPALAKSAATKIPGAASLVKNIASKGPFGAAKSVVGDKRAMAAKALEEMGVTIDETKIAEDLVNYATNKAPLTLKKKAEDFALTGIDMFKNPNATITKTLENLKQANDAAYLQSGKLGRPAAAKIEKVVGDAIRKQIGEKAPNVAAANKAFEMIYKGEKLAKNTASKYAPIGVLGKILGGF